MAVRLLRCPRRPPFPLWSAVVVLVWGGLVAAGHFLSERTGVPMASCLFRRATGIPCPTCGATRVVFRGASGELAWSFATNPLVFVLLALLLLSTLLRVVAGRRVDLGLPPLSPRGRRIAMAAFLGLIALNWVYLISHGT